MIDVLARIHTIRVERVPNGRETDHVPVCSCGWEGLATADRFAAATKRCAVLEAEQEGAARRARRLQSLGVNAA